MKISIKLKLKEHKESLNSNWKSTTKQKNFAQRYVYWQVWRSVPLVSSIIESRKTFLASIQKFVLNTIISCIQIHVFKLCLVRIISYNLIEVSSLLDSSTSSLSGHTLNSLHAIARSPIRSHKYTCELTLLETKKYYREACSNS
jgi:hypothetical protein